MIWVNDPQEPSLTLEQKQQVAQALIDRANKEENSKYEEINLYTTYLAAKAVLETTKRICECFKADAWINYNKYLDALEVGQDIVQLLANYRVCMHCADFYNKEAELLIKEMKDCKAWIKTLSLRDWWRFVWQGYDKRVILRDLEFSDLDKK